MTSKRLGLALALGLGLGLVGCRGPRANQSSEESSALPSWAVAPSAEPERPGMVWIPPGVLIAGTPPGKLPRVADQELPGERIELHGFFIDRYSYPGEPGAIPETGITQADARDKCERQGKRLCTELEWERACKGPNNLTYEYGDAYDAAICGMGNSDSLAPNGLYPKCESGFGAHDLHGSAWTWTSSPWGRGEGAGKFSVRGGNGKRGLLIGRCANARALGPKERDAIVGVRCCAGDVNAKEVELAVSHKTDLRWKNPDAATARLLESVAPKDLTAGGAGERLHIERTWLWRPIGNEELLVGGGCAHRLGGDACGIAVVRVEGERASWLAWVSSDAWIPVVGQHDSPRGLYLYGGDRLGAYRKAVMFDWGTISEGQKERKKRGGWVKPP